MARHRKPAALTAAQGNTGKRAKRILSRLPDAGMSGVPAIIAGKEFVAAREHWRRLHPQLASQKLITDLDQDVLARYCVALDNWLKAECTLRKEGATQSVTTVSGDAMIRVHPMAKIRSLAEQTLDSLGPKLGLNPADRFAMLRTQASVFSGQLTLLPSKPEQAEAPSPSAPPAGIVGMLATPIEGKPN
jgi:P27 family predicted phage terminase small subunit